MTTLKNYECYLDSRERMGEGLLRARISSSSFCATPARRFSIAWFPFGRNGRISVVAVAGKTVAIKWKHLKEVWLRQSAIAEDCRDSVVEIELDSISATVKTGSKQMQQVLFNGNVIATTLRLTATQIDPALIFGEIYVTAK